MPRLILVSNRLPVSVRLADGAMTVQRSLGGLATGLAGPHERMGGAWIGWPGPLEGLSPEQRAELDARLDELRLVPVEIGADDLRGFYEGFSNGILWPLFHYMLGQVNHAPEDWDAYTRVNRRYAEIAAAHWRPGDLLWVHDYQLMLVPEFLRELLPEARIGFFLHIPFPASAVFRGLPHGRELLRGLLGADLIGFHTASYLRHFGTNVLRALGATQEVDRLPWMGREVHLAIFPMGVDAQHIQELAESAPAEEEGRALRGEGDQRLLVGIDRLDYTKGLPRRLLAFQRLLEQHPELSERVRLIQVAVPSREGVDAYKEVRAELDGLVGSINGKFGTTRWTPVRYVQKSLDALGVAALCRAADVLLVTPVRDGMNLVAKEFAAARSDEDGVLVLSELAGAAHELRGALLVNPYDVDQVAAAVFRALEMPREERRRRMNLLRERVFTHDVHRWGDAFIARLESLPAARPRPSVTRTAASSLAQAHTARELVLLLDYDGTLRRFEEDPELANPDGELLDLLDRLSRREGTSVHLVSGRPRGDLERWFGHLGVGLHGEHGLWSRFPGEPWQRARIRAPRHLDRVRTLLEEFVDFVPGAHVEAKDVTLAFHWRAADLEHRARPISELRLHLAFVCSGIGVELLPGDHVLEIRPAGLGKSLVVNRVASRVPETATFLAMGDDSTDEELFASLPENAISIRIGPEPSCATTRLDSIEAARGFLQDLARTRPASLVDARAPEREPGTHDPWT